MMAATLICSGGFTLYEIKFLSNVDSIDIMSNKNCPQSKHCDFLNTTSSKYPVESDSCLYSPNTEAPCAPVK